MNFWLEMLLSRFQLLLYIYKYYNNNIMDGEQWNITYLEDNIKYFGSNEYPSNFKDAFILLDNTFK